MFVCRLVFILLIYSISYADFFTCAIQESGGDYNSLGSWENAIDCDLTKSTGTRVFKHAGITGTLSDNATVWGATSKSTGTLCHATTSQILLKGIDGEFTSGEKIYSTETTNFIVVSDSGNPAVAHALIQGTWTTSEGTVAIEGWDTSADNYIFIQAVGSARAGTTLSSTCWYMRSSAAQQLRLNEENVRVDGLQINPNLFSVQRIIGVYLNSTDKIHLANYTVSNCLIVNSSYTANSDWTYPPAGIYSSNGSSTTVKIYNNIMWNWGNGVYINNSIFTTTSVIYCNSFYNCDRGTVAATLSGAIIVPSNALYNVYLKDNIVVGSTKCYTIGASAVVTSTKNLSSDATSPDVELRDLIPSFVNNVVSDNMDLHIVASDTSAINMGMNLTTDPNGWINITTDQEGQTRPTTGTQNWTLGADEYITSVLQQMRRRFISVIRKD